MCNTYLLSHLWHIAQLLPIPERHAQHITTIITGQLWKGWVFRVPITTLQKPYLEGGMNMVGIRAKCATLYFMRMELHRNTQNLPTAHWLHTMKTTIQWKNPPNRTHLTKNLEYLAPYTQQWAYIG
jgi:hypothetical protein